MEMALQGKSKERLYFLNITFFPLFLAADCLAGFEVVSHSCMVSTRGALAYADAENYCNSNDSRLAKIVDGGTRALVTRFFPGKTWIGKNKSLSDHFLLASCLLIVFVLTVYSK